MNTIITLIIGMAIWQAICVVVGLITREDVDKVAIVAYGIWVLPFAVTGFLYRKLALVIVRNTYNGYRFYHNGKSENTYYMSKKLASTLNQNPNAEYHIEKICDGKTFKSVPYKREIYHGQKNFNGWDMGLFRKG